MGGFFLSEHYSVLKFYFNKYKDQIRNEKHMDFTSIKIIVKEPIQHFKDSKEL